MQTMALTGLAMVALMSACATPKPMATIDPAVRLQAVDDARGLMDEVYRSLRRGNSEGLLPLLEPDALLVGPAATQIFTDRSEALLALGGVLSADKYKLTSLDLRVGASATGQGAWATDRIRIAGDEYNVAAFMVQRDELWTLATVVVGAPHKAKRKGGRKGRSGDDAGVSITERPEVAGGAPTTAARSHLAAGVVDPSFLADQLAPSSDVVVLGPEGGKPLVGRRAIRKRWREREPGEASISGEPRVGMVPDGSLVWVLADVAEGEVAQRWFAIYAPTEPALEGQDDGDDAPPPAWQLHALHRSTPSP